MKVMRGVGMGVACEWGGNVYGYAPGAFFKKNLGHGAHSQGVRGEIFLNHFDKRAATTRALTKFDLWGDLCAYLLGVADYADFSALCVLEVRECEHDEIE